MKSIKEENAQTYFKRPLKCTGPLKRNCSFLPPEYSKVSLDSPRAQHWNLTHWKETVSERQNSKTVNDPHPAPRWFLPAILWFGNGVGTALAVILGHIFTLLEGGSLVFQNVSDTESVTVESPLLAQFGAIWAQGLIVNLREVYMFPFIHHVTLFLVNIS